MDGRGLFLTEMKTCVHACVTMENKREKHTHGERERETKTEAQIPTVPVMCVRACGCVYNYHQICLRFVYWATQGINIKEKPPTHTHTHTRYHICVREGGEVVFARVRECGI